jgi:hypothetical protein
MHSPFSNSTIAATLLFLACGHFLPARGTLLSNGDFEISDPGPEPVLTFPGWGEFTGDTTVAVKNSAAIAQTFSPIGGTASAEIVAGASPGGALRQGVLDGPVKFTLELEFAMLSPDGGAAATARFFQVLIKHGGETSINQINLRVVTSGALQAFDGSAFQTIGSLAAAFTTDSGTSGIFDGETPVVNTLRVVGDYDTTDGTPLPMYDVTLNGVTVSNLMFFQGTAGSAADNGIDAIAFLGTAASKNFLVDNVVLVPEPSSAALLLPGLAWLGFRRRQRAA